MEPAIPAHLRCPRTQETRMPAGFEAPYPAWMARYTEGTDPFVMAYFGAQQHSLLPPDALAPIDAMLARGPVPGHARHGRCHDRAGYDTRIVIAYWSDPAAFSAWRRESGFDTWWADPARESGPVGWFVEAVTPPAERVEVQYSTPDGIEGLGHLQANLSEQPVTEHAYWGSARDRIPAPQTDVLAGPQEGAAVSRAGARVRVVPRENLTMIRSGQNWSRTEAHERSVYMEQVRPKLIAGMEAWAEHHPTHVAIFGTFLKTMAPLGTAMQLRLFHEATALPASAQWFEYVNCHPGTGLLAAAMRDKAGVSRSGTWYQPRANPDDAPRLALQRRLCTRSCGGRWVA